MIFAGFGGQGIMTAGKLLAACAMAEDKHVTYFPAYGTEVRGGTANCQVVVSDEEIASPLVEEATSLIVMNGPSMTRFFPELVKGGVMVLNTSICEPPEKLDGRRVLGIDATELARDVGAVQVANVLMLAALNEVRRIVDPSRLLSIIVKGLSGRKAQFVPMNEKAFETGRKLAAEWLKKL
jgi:2-oxoglutarate ferredoxin oxidoreductase subunit gamma